MRFFLALCAGVWLMVASRHASRTHWNHFPPDHQKWLMLLDLAIAALCLTQAISRRSK